MMIFSRGNLQLASEDSWHFACKSMIYNQKDKDSTSRRQFCWSSDQPRSLPSLETGCTFALFFSQSIFLPVLISQQSASNWILFHPSELQTQVKKSSFSWQLFASCKRYLTEPVSEMWCEKFNIISNNVNININYQEFLWRAVCHDSRLGFSWKGFLFHSLSNINVICFLSQ